ncbi:MAG: glycosyltransferase family 2 protein, partial [Anaerolineae bacterium]
MMKPPRVSIVIVNWNGKDLLGPGLSSLRQQHYHDFEVVVVDNGSTDGSSAFVRESFPEVRLLELPTNRGFAGGCNVGIRATQSELIATLNNDTTVEPEWLGELIRAMDAHDEAGS